ncbi:hypothetical protein BKA65DRAFT_485542 [Rhexocercosporidium sp. MPI-PUGE-AT-0058]|nr:hypothetical protein BKA65DRAFT_485542 [Rhexocercosporidium sp. MPI-PUGE-AT-0058]
MGRGVAIGTSVAIGIGGVVIGPFIVFGAEEKPGPGCGREIGSRFGFRTFGAGGKTYVAVVKGPGAGDEQGDEERNQARLEAGPGPGLLDVNNPPTHLSEAPPTNSSPTQPPKRPWTTK